MLTDQQIACLLIAAGPSLIGFAWALGNSAVVGLLLDRAEGSVLRLRDWMEA